VSRAVRVVARASHAPRTGRATRLFAQIIARRATRGLRADSSIRLREVKRRGRRASNNTKRGRAIHPSHQHQPRSYHLPRPVPASSACG
jgi:hypothetical protein